MKKVHKKPAAWTPIFGLVGLASCARADLWIDDIGDRGAGETELARAAAGLRPGTWSALATGLTSDELRPLTGSEPDVIDASQSILSLADGGGWDPVRRRAYFAGGLQASCCPNNRFLIYDERRNGWSRGPTTGQEVWGGGDGGAADPGTGAYYYRGFGARVIQRFDGDGWQGLPPHPFTSTGSQASITWFPEIGGLVFAHGLGPTAWFDGVQWHTVVAEGELTVPWGEYLNFAEYSRAQRLIWMGGGHNAERVTYRLDASLTVERLADAPFALKAGSTLHAADPESGRFVVFRFADGSWWDYDALADRWAPIGWSMPPLRPRANGGAMQIPISTYGVIMFVEYVYGEDAPVYLYRHGTP